MFDSERSLVSKLARGVVSLAASGAEVVFFPKAHTFGNVERVNYDPKRGLIDLEQAIETGDAATIRGAHRFLNGELSSSPSRSANNVVTRPVWLR